MLVGTTKCFKFALEIPAIRIGNFRFDEGSDDKSRVLEFGLSHHCMAGFTAQQSSGNRVGYDDAKSEMT